MKVYQVFAVDITPTGFSSDYQDHRTENVVASFIDEDKAIQYRDYVRSTKRFAARIESFEITE